MVAKEEIEESGYGKSDDAGKGVGDKGLPEDKGKDK